MADTESLLSTLANSAWHVVRRQQVGDLLPEDVRRRYPRLPADVESFLGGLEACVNKGGTVWFLTPDNFRQCDDRRFRWNEHELMCLDAARGECEEIEAIRAYWDRHFPIMFSVHSDYDYLAVDLRPEAFGQIVHGYMPEPEQPGLVARSFPEFVTMFNEALRSQAEYPLTLFT